MSEIKNDDEIKKQIALEMKSVTKRIEEDIRILTSNMDEIGQTEMFVFINGWEVSLTRVNERGLS